MKKQVQIICMLDKSESTPNYGIILEKSLNPEDKDIYKRILNPLHKYSKVI